MFKMELNYGYVTLFYKNGQMTGLCCKILIVEGELINNGSMRKGVPSDTLAVDR